MKGIRLIFLNHVSSVINEGETQKSKPSSDWLWRFKGAGIIPAGKSTGIAQARIRDLRNLVEVAQFRCQEKPRRELLRCPYRNPTQVDR